MGSVTIGIDLGQKVDPTAIAVAECERRERGLLQETHFSIRHLERLPLGTSYPAVAERIASVVRKVTDRGDYQPDLYVDATGVGQPVVDLIRQLEIEARIMPVYFTHGDRRTVEPGRTSLGKAYLVSRLQALLQGGRLHLPETDEARQLAQELLDYEIRVDPQANDRYGAFRVGAHDDLVTAVGLAVQIDPWNPAPLGVFGVSQHDRLSQSEYRDADDDLLEEDDSQEWCFGSTMINRW